MLSLILSFLTSFAITLLLIRTKKLQHLHFLDYDLTGPQKIHTEAVPRIGGVGVALGVLIGIIFSIKQDLYFYTEIILLTSTMPAFFIGLAEDITKKISVRLRLAFTLIGATLITLVLQLSISSIGVPYVDSVLTIPLIGAIVAVFAITGLTNAYNIIDGFNGLASMTGILSLLGIFYLSYLFQDSLLIHLSLIMASSILGFFIWNYPRGLIFMGDAGAYFIGFWIAVLSILIVCRHHEISPWFALLINGYPTLETLFSIYRRKIHQNKNPGNPDGIHFHTLIYRRILIRRSHEKNLLSANAATAPYLWLFGLSGTIPALIWWNSTSVLMFISLCFCLLYVCIYSKIVKFKTPKWLFISHNNQ